MQESFTQNLLVFARLLRYLGLEITPEQVSDLASIAARVGVAKRQDLYLAARAIFVRRHSDLQVFDAAFNLFFQTHGTPQQSIVTPTQLPVRRGPRPSSKHLLQEELQSRKESNVAPDGSQLEQDERLAWSPAEILKHKNFEHFTPDEIRTARRLIAEMDWRVGERKTRRKHSALHGKQLDLTRVVRRNIPYGLELFRLPERENKFKTRPLVILADVSGSMERYTRMVIHLLHALSHEMDRVEVFTFGTRLTRITGDLKRKSVEAAVHRAAWRVPDWSGGTRIGEALKTFNFKWSRRVLRAGAVVLIISDGWDRGDLEILRDEMERLQRNCFRLIWLNPLLGSPSFQPTAQGMNVALPFVDDFLPVHNIISLESLVAKLSSLESGRPLRRQQPHVILPAEEPPHPQRVMELPQMGTSDYGRRTMTLRTIDGVPIISYEDNPG